MNNSTDRFKSYLALAIMTAFVLLTLLGDWIIDCLLN